MSEFTKPTRKGFLDLEGHHYGQLEVLSYAGPHRANQQLWLCRCACGTEKKIVGSSLRRKREPTRSCGCLGRKSTSEEPAKPADKRFLDLEGERFTRLVVLSYVRPRGKKDHLWLCHCDCGTEKVMSGNGLRGGRLSYQSCGCLYKEKKPGADRSCSPFPDDIDREQFGYWLSGFTDGEGCFFLGYYKPGNEVRAYRVRFRIALRADDAPCLRLIQSYFGCGGITFADRPESKDDTVASNPAVAFTIDSALDLYRVVVPHFDRYPLRSKKARDYQIWRQGVELLHEVSSRPVLHLPAGRGRGTISRWSAEEIERFVQLHHAIRAQRQFVDLMSSVAEPQQGVY